MKDFIKGLIVGMAIVAAAILFIGAARLDKVGRFSLVGIYPGGLEGRKEHIVMLDTQTGIVFVWWPEDKIGQAINVPHGKVSKISNE